MHIILDSYGVQLEKAENMFSIKQGEQERSISPVKVTAIHIYKTAQLSTAALLMAAENDIPVLIYDMQGKPAVRIWNSNFTSTGQVRINQPLFCSSISGIWWCKHIAALKMQGQLHNLSFFANRFTAAAEPVNAAAQTIEKIKTQVAELGSDIAVQGSLLGYEGSASAAYWHAIDAILDDAVFTRRIQRNAKEPFNACVNYLYGVLYGKVEGALIACGLDPMVGLMHTEGYGKKSLVYDCIEPFRQWAELLLVTLFKNNTLGSTHFVYEPERMQLTKECRKILITEFNNFMLQKTLMNERRISRNDQVTALCSALAQAVKNFKPQKNTTGELPAADKL